jgi:hypothetical protein
MFLLTDDFARTLVRYLDGNDLLAFANVDARFYRAAVRQMIALDDRWLRVSFLRPKAHVYYCGPCLEMWARGTYICRCKICPMLARSCRLAMSSRLEIEPISIKRDKYFFRGLMGKNQYFAAQARYKLVTTRIEDLFAFSSRHCERTKNLAFLDVWERSSPGTITILSSFVNESVLEEDLHEARQT